MNLVYTAIYGEYDKLWKPRKICDGWEYRCYTDQSFSSDVWKVIKRPLPYGPARNGRFIKITHPMEKFDNILWIDGCVEIKGDLNEFLRELPKSDFVTATHSFLNSLKGELRACINMKKDDTEIMKRQVKEYGEVAPYKHVQTTIILRKNECKPFTDIWWNEVKNKSKRDQLSFGWAIQQSGQKYATVNWSLMTKYFIWHSTHSK